MATDEENSVSGDEGVQGEGVAAWLERRFERMAHDFG
jgi:hypothetical protein